MMQRIRKAMADKDQGFTLIELLVVMIIIGILAAIAIPVFLNQRAKAAETSAKSDATNIAKEVAAALVDGNPATMTLTGGNNQNGTSTIKAVLAVAGSPNTDVTVGVGNNVTMTWDAATGKYCVTADPFQANANTWSASADGIFKAATCP